MVLGGKVTVINCNSNFEDYNITGGTSSESKPMDGNYRVSLEDIMTNKWIKCQNTENSY